MSTAPLHTYDDENVGPILHRHQVRTARKQHECAAGCSAPIAPGEQYVEQVTAIADEGGWHRTRTHLRCW